MIETCYLFLLHRDLIFSVCNQVFPLGGNWSDEKVSLGVVVAVLATCVPLASARTCHSYTDCVTSMQPGFPTFSCLALLDNLAPVSVFSRLAPAAYTQSESGEAIRSIVP